MNTKVTELYELDVLWLVHMVWKNKIVLFYSWILSILFAFAYVMQSPKAYTSKTSMVSQVNSLGSSMGGLSGLAAMAGVSMDNKSGIESMTPSLYPKVMESAPFQLALMNHSFNVSGGQDNLTLFQYFTDKKEHGVINGIKKYTIGLPSLLMNSLKQEAQPAEVNPNTVQFSEDQEMVSTILKDRIKLQIDPKNGYLTLEATFEDPQLAAQVVGYTRELLQEYITRFKIQKAREELDFIQQLYDEKEEVFLKSQRKLAGFRDNNQFTNLAILRAEEERLQTQFSIASSVYMDLAKQLEQAKIKVKEETPVFMVVEPAKVPIHKTSPRIKIILGICLLIGTLTGILLIFLRYNFRNIKGQWQNYN